MIFSIFGKAINLGSMKILRPLSDPQNKNSFSVKWRRKRFKLFTEILADLKPPVRILDVGGTDYFWKNVDFTPESHTTIVLLNLYTINTSLPWLSSEVGDGTDLSRFADKEFDIVFSNSVIEHLGTWEKQQKMAKEIQRVGKHYFVQTPNHYFPMEPHFLFPFFHFLPHWLKVSIVRNFDSGWFDKIEDKNLAEEAVRSIRLLTRKELLQLFPGCNIFKEKVMGMTKSFVAWK